MAAGACSCMACPRARPEHRSRIRVRSAPGAIRASTVAPHRPLRARCPPNLDTTLENYDNAAGYLKNLDPNLFNDNELTKAIIAAIGDLDTYQLPDAKGYTSMMRHLTGKTDAMLQKKRDEILSTNGEDFISFGEVLEKAAKSEAVAVIGSQAAIEGSKAGLKVTKVL